MEARNCIKCKQVFNYINTPYCPKCVKEEEVVFDSVREYIKENPNCTLMETVDATGVSVKKITKYIKDGRLEISKGMQGENIFQCELCGIPIIKGKYCDSCLVKIGQDMSVVFKNPRIKTGPQIYSSKK